jgi:hypothetical protein
MSQKLEKHELTTKVPQLTKLPKAPTQQITKVPK